jgi:hypothetical protein
MRNRNGNSCTASLYTTTPMPMPMAGCLVMAIRSISEIVAYPRRFPLYRVKTFFSCLQKSIFQIASKECWRPYIDFRKRLIACVNGYNGDKKLSNKIFENIIYFLMISCYHEISWYNDINFRKQFFVKILNYAERTFSFAIYVEIARSSEYISLIL